MCKLRPNGMNTTDIRLWRRPNVGCASKRIPRKRAIPKHRPKIYFLFFSLSFFVFRMDFMACIALRWVSASVFLWTTEYNTRNNTVGIGAIHFYRHWPFCSIFIATRFSVARYTAGIGSMRGIFSWTAFCRNHRPTCSSMMSRTQAQKHTKYFLCGIVSHENHRKQQNESNSENPRKLWRKCEGENGKM